MKHAEKRVVNQTQSLAPCVGGLCLDVVDELAPMRWVNPITQRYYSARLVLNLFGQWELQQVWGSLTSRRGRLRYVPLAGLNEGRQQLTTLARLRRLRGYIEQPLSSSFSGT
ncbi:hypothetical protein CAP48_19805 (plasmid) [Advenella sp. S44]|uniref:hypothetical protein n=1 Tax=unclassified Advenella TaxID=2685285 RepID=UPI000C2AF2FC|nr:MULTISPECIES: hypothetical protein [unclassified Advenella]PJX19953.1 hypothetical protein CAP48_19805 [Advenella sp. S44]